MRQEGTGREKVPRMWQVYEGLVLFRGLSENRLEIRSQTCLLNRTFKDIVWLKWLKFRKYWNCVQRLVILKINLRWIKFKHFWGAFTATVAQISNVLLETLKIINRKLGTVLNLHPKTIILILNICTQYFIICLWPCGVSMSTDHWKGAAEFLQERTRC